MPSYRLAALALLALLVAALSLGLWLRSAAGRDWLVVQVQQVIAASTGYRVTLQESAGNPWRGLALFDLTVEGPGVAAQLERLDVAYGVGSLVRGRLPLELRLSGLRGDLSLEDLSLENVSLPEAGGGGSGPRLELRRLEVVDAGLRVGGVAYPLPDLHLRELRLRDRAGGLALSGRLGGEGGEAGVRAELDYAPLELRLELEEADLRLARAFWGGAEGGTVNGQLTLLNGPPRGDFTLQGGRGALAGLTFGEVAGPLRYRHPVITAELEGRTLEGPVQATGEVDVEARRWRASVRGRPALTPTGAWLAEDRLPFDADALGLEGEAEVGLEAWGWQAFSLEGRGQGRGRALGQELESLTATFGYESGSGARVEARAHLGEGTVGEGTVEVSLEPTAGGFRGRLDATELALGDGANGLTASLEATFEGEGESLRAEAALAGEIGGRPLELAAGARLEAGVWSAEATGVYDGAPVTAAGRLEGERVRAEARVSGLPWLEAATATLLVEGPPTEARWSLALEGDAPLRPLLAGTRLEADLQGSLRGKLSAAEVTIAEGSLGPLELRGAYAFGNGVGDLHYRLEEVDLAGMINGRLGLAEGTLTLAEGRLETRGELQASLAAGPLLLEEVAARFGGSLAEGALELNVSDARGLAASYGEEGVAVSFEGYPLTLAGAPWTLEGTVEGTVKGTVKGAGDELELELRAVSAHGELGLRGDGERAAFSLRAAPGQPLGPLELAQPVTLDGELRLAGRALELTGAAGALPLTLGANWAEASLAVTAALTSGDEELEVTFAGGDFAGGGFASGDFSVLGGLPLAALGELVGAELAGRLVSDLERQGGALRGRLDLVLDPVLDPVLEPVLEPGGAQDPAPLRLGVLGAGAEARLSGGGTVLGRRLELSGRLLPELEAELSLGELGGLVLRRSGGDLVLTGGGRASVAALGLGIDEAWQLEGSLGERQARLRLGASEARLDWAEEGWAVTAELEQAASLAGTEARLRAEVQVSAAEPEGRIGGVLELAQPDAQPDAQSNTSRGELALAGSLRELSLRGSLPGALFAARGGPGGNLADGLADGLAGGTLEVTGSANLLEGPSYTLAARGPAGLELSLHGLGAQWQAGARGDGLEAHLGRGDAGGAQWSLTVDAFEPGRVFAVPESLSLSGRLEGGAGGYSGELVGRLADTPEPAFRLRGAEGALLLRAGAEFAGTRLTVQGQLLPALGLRLTAERPGLAELAGEVGGSLASPNLSGTLRLLEREAGGVRLSAQTLPVEAAWGERGLVARVGEAAFEEGVWSGELSLPLVLGGQAHRLAGPVGGPLAEPRWEAVLAGPLAQGTLLASQAGAEGRLRLNAGPWLAAWDEARLEAVLEAAPDGRWSLAVTAEGEAAALRDTALGLSGTLRGEGGRYSGEGTLHANGQAARLTLAGEGIDLRAALELADVDLGALTLPAGTSGRASGRVELTHAAAGGLGYRADLTAAGRVRTQPFELTLQGDETGLTLTGQVAEVALRGERLEDAVSLRASGRWNEEALSLEASYSGGEGRWQARYGESSAAGELRAVAAGYELTGAGELAALPGLAGPAEAGFAGQWRGGRLRLDAASWQGDGFGLDLSGDAWPRAALAGELRAASLGEPLAIEVTGGEGDAEGYKLKLHQPGLLAELALDPAAAGGAPRWRLEGLELALPAELRLVATGAGELAGDLAGGRLEGALMGRGERLPLTATYGADGLELSADGRLLGGKARLHARHAEGSGWTGELELENVTLAGSTVAGQGVISGPLMAPALQGNLTAMAAWGELAADVGLSRAALELGGRLASPQLGGALELSGRLWPEPDFRLVSGETSLRVANGRAEGGLEVTLGEGALQSALGLRADPEGALELTLDVAGEAGPSLRGPWPDDPRRGLRLTGTGNTAGALELRLEDEPRLLLEALSWTGGYGRGRIEGVLAWRGGPAGTLSGAWTPPPMAGDEADGTGLAWLPWTETLGTLPLALDLRPGRLEVAAGGLAGQLLWEDALALSLSGRQALGAGEVALDLRYSEAEGASGDVSLSAVELLAQQGADPHGLGSLSLSAALELSARGLSGSGRLEAERGRLSLSGEAGWKRLLPEGVAARFLPEGGENLQGLARLDAFNLAHLPAVAAALPELDAPVTGVAQFIGDAVIGQVLVPELSVAGRGLPSEFDFSGNWQEVELRGRLGHSRATLTYGRGRLAGLVNLEGFPLESLVEARFGPSGVTAGVTGLVRFDLPLDDLARSDVRLASERIRLARGGVVSEGELALRYDETGLVLETAEFRGAGLWQAGGRLGPDGLDFSLRAEDADFGPLLALLLPLAGQGPGLRGSLDLHLAGTADAPTLTARSPRLEVSLGGARYRLAETELEVTEGQVAGRSRLEGVQPGGGALELSVGGRLGLFPLAAGDFELSFAGSAALPVVGLIDGLQGRVLNAGGDWRLESEGRLGEPFTLSGSLVPLDLSLTGRHLALAAPRYYLLESELDADLRLRYGDGFRLSGTVFGHGARLGFEGRDAGGAPAVAVREEASNPLLERVHFDGLHIQAPQQLVFRESLGNLELSADLVLTGTAAEPLLAGSARLVRGGLRFSGRDFTVQDAEALFAPARGRYPVIRARAETSFDKSRVLSAEARELVSFAAPREGHGFRVLLDLYGEFVEAAPGVQRLHLEPTLSSDALIEDRRGGGVRPLQDEEIVTLLTLGRLELGADVRQALRGEAVAQTALDTAIDLYLLAELQQALAEVLGVDVLEIRAGALSGLLEAGESDFSVSVRVGTYLADEVFASFSLGRFQYAPELYALGGGFNLRYDLSPLELSLSGGLGLPRGSSAGRGLGAQLVPVPEFNLGLSYGVSPLVKLGAGLDLRGGAGNDLASSVGVRFGLDFRW